MYRYRISGYYYSDDNLVRFDEEIEAPDNTRAMCEIIGYFAWKESIDEHTFKLSDIHYEVLR